mmetsp:Transcript_8344/g.17366  ORF Transcript_8344/g.17366 Transcript_8344/m.17366 type:complete len:322 (-) Transcript_8344:443-1408(-)
MGHHPVHDRVDGTRLREVEMGRHPVGTGSPQAARNHGLREFGFLGVFLLDGILRKGFVLDGTVRGNSDGSRRYVTVSVADHGLQDAAFVASGQEPPERLGDTKRRKPVHAIGLAGFLRGLVVARGQVVLLYPVQVVHAPNEARVNQAVLSEHAIAVAAVVGFVETGQGAEGIVVVVVVLLPVRLAGGTAGEVAAVEVRRKRIRAADGSPQLLVRCVGHAPFLAEGHRQNVEGLSWFQETHDRDHHVGTQHQEGAGGRSRCRAVSGRIIVGTGRNRRWLAIEIGVRIILVGGGTAGRARRLGGARFGGFRFALFRWCWCRSR